MIAQQTVNPLDIAFIVAFLILTAFWPVVDPLPVALPLSALTAVVVSLLMKPPDPAHLSRCFAPTAPEPKR